MITTRRLATTLVAACVATGLAVAPAATAAESGSGTKATAALAKKKGPTTRKLNSDLTKVRKRTTKAEKTIRSLDKTLDSLQALAKGTDGKANTLLAAAPQLISGLTQLGDAVTKQIAPGLTKLADAVEKQIAPGLTRLGTAVASTEYAVGQVFVGGTPLAGAFIVTPDIPDAAQQAQVSQQFVVTTPQAPAAITVRVAVRTAESDGKTPTDPAAACRVTVDGDGSPPAGFVTSTPNANLGGAPFHPIPGSPQTKTDEPAFPFGPKSDDVFVDLTTAENSAGTAMANTGVPFSVSLACVDTSPSATDTSA